MQVKGECVTKKRELLLQSGSLHFLSSLYIDCIGRERYTLINFFTLTCSDDVISDVPEDFRVYSDDVNKFKIMIPSDWHIGAREGDGVTIVITSLGADFSKLESFGKFDAFAENLGCITSSTLYKISVKVSDIYFQCLG
ncbi:hypothetical protein H5410_061558 [Solanum commersonii]|uniref:Uncharacterized protein n=1 Tax=Solanum commersonii TaxID=4109 RepID=A0A9J5W9J8_SOLCO|nr:hypothetical protein H5410_061558 [Solanum commersonii]